MTTDRQRLLTVPARVVPTVLGVLALTLAGCGGGDDAGPQPTATDRPATSVPPTTTSTSATSTMPASTSTTSTTSTTTTSTTTTSTTTTSTTTTVPSIDAEAVLGAVLTVDDLGEGWRPYPEDRYEDGFVSDRCGDPGPPSTFEPVAFVRDRGLLDETVVDSAVVLYDDAESAALGVDALVAAVDNCPVLESIVDGIVERAAYELAPIDPVGGCDVISVGVTYSYEGYEEQFHQSGRYARCGPAVAFVAALSYRPEHALAPGFVDGLLAVQVERVTPLVADAG